MPQLPTRKPPTTTSREKSVQILPGVTAVVVIPFVQRRAIGGLARQKNGPEITMRINDLDRVTIQEGAKLCGLSVADYARQCAINMTNALKAQINAPAPVREGPRDLPEDP